MRTDSAENISRFHFARFVVKFFREKNRISTNFPAKHSYEL